MAVGLTYDRLMAFTLFLEEGYHRRPEAERPPRFCSEALAATMLEIFYWVLRERQAGERLVEILPILVYMCLAPFMGPEAAGEFVEKKMNRAAP
jgi:hypothetical protein